MRRTTPLGIRFLRIKKTDAGQELVDGRVGLYGVDMGAYFVGCVPQDPGIRLSPSTRSIPTWDAYQSPAQTFIGTDSSTANSLVDSHWTSDLTDLALQLYLMRREDSRLPPSGSVGDGFKLLCRKEPGAFETLTRYLYVRQRTRDAGRSRTLTDVTPLR